MAIKIKGCALTLDVLVALEIGPGRIGAGVAPAMDIPNIGFADPLLHHIPTGGW